MHSLRWLLASLRLRKMRPNFAKYEHGEIVFQARDQADYKFKSNICTIKEEKQFKNVIHTVIERPVKP